MTTATRTKRFEIVRFYRDNATLNGTVIGRNLTEEQAKAHCQNPETSSSTCSKPENVKRTECYGPWFDGFREQATSDEENYRSHDWTVVDDTIRCFRCEIGQWNGKREYCGGAL